MEQIDRTRVQRLVGEESVQLVEVLPAKEYNEEHLPGAVNIPLKKLGDEALKAPRPGPPPGSGSKRPWRGPCANVADGWEVAVVCTDRGVVLDTTGPTPWE